MTEDIISIKVTYGLIIFVTLMAFLIGFLVILGLDAYTPKPRKRLFVIIITLVFLHLMQNYVEYWMMWYYATPWRTLVAVFGYSLRPALLALFARLIDSKKKHIVAWCLVGLNVIMHLTAFFTSLVFTIDNNHYIGGPLNHWCLATSVALLVYLVILAALKYKKEKVQIREIVFHLFWVLLIVAGILADAFLNQKEQWVDYLSISMVCVAVFSYIWLHQRYVYEYQTNFIAEQRIRVIFSQIQPHFIYNTLSSIRNIEGNPEETKRAITEFANYIRGNLAALDGKALIPFDKEMEYVKDYISLQQRRFPERINVFYDISDTDFSIPPLTVQILVENAVKHGITARYESGTVILRTYREKRYHVINVVDDGVGFDTKILETTDRVGLRAVKNRLEYFLDGRITIESKVGKGTAVTIKIPVSTPTAEKVIHGM